MNRRHLLVRITLTALAAASLASASACRLKIFDPEMKPEDVETSLFLIGDAGEPDPRERSVSLDMLALEASAVPQKSVIVFLGDNVYPDGIPEEGRAEYADARRRLEAQVSAIPRGTRAIFIPGNHDWAGMGPFGLYAVRLQEQMIAGMAQGRDIRTLPGNGCPGPVSLDFGRLRFVAIDTQWWLHPFIVHDAQTKCAIDIQSVTRALRAQVQPPGEGRLVVVAGHHPLMTGGEHGGYCGITGPFRRFGGYAQDILSGPNVRMRDSIETAFGVRPPLVYAAGHEHNLQVLRGGATVQYLLVSGAGSQEKAACGVWLRESYYVAQHRTGFMRIDIMRNKGAFLRVYEYKGDGTGGVSYTRWLEMK
jgi:hypothetical protein